MIRMQVKCCHVDVDHQRAKICHTNTLVLAPSICFKLPGWFHRGCQPEQEELHQWLCCHKPRNGDFDVSIALATRCSK